MKRTPIARKTPMKRRRATPRRRPAPRFTVEEWQNANDLLMARSGGVCERCGSYNVSDPYRYERHHRQRRRDGGDRLSNLLYLCGGPNGCHQWVTEHPKEARRTGFIVSVNRDPAEVPVYWQRRSWRILYDDGYITRLFEEIEDAHA